MARPHSPRARLMIYLKGWRAGAGGKAIAHEQDEDYMRGYTDGQQACKLATIGAEAFYKYKPSVLRVQEKSVR